MPNTRLKLVLSCFMLQSILLLSSAVDPPTPGSISYSSDGGGLPPPTTTSILKDVAVIRHAIYDFWQQYGPDPQCGGFHGTLDLEGVPIPPRAKGLVQQTRHVWAFSTFYKHGYTHSARPGPSSSAAADTLLSSREMAHTAFNFVVRHMHDPTSQLFVWNVTRDGTQVVQADKVIYGHWFVLYGLSQFHAVFGGAQARDLALTCWRAMDAAWHSSTLGGYDETPDNQIPPTPQRVVVPGAGPPSGPAGGTLPGSSHAGGRELPGTPGRQAASGTDAEPAGQHRQLEKGQQPAALTRTLNIAMHGLEALTALHKITDEPVVLQRILESLDILCTKLAREQGLIFEEYIPSPDGLWQPASGTVVNYGHNLESCWLVADTLDYLLHIGAVPTQLAAEYLDTVMSIGAAAVRDGYDREHGGFFESGSPMGGPSSRVKVWWIQAEGMLALWKLHLHFEGGGDGGGSSTSTSTSRSGGGQAPFFLQALAHTVRFVRLHITDWPDRPGEQFWQVQPDGAFVSSNNIDRDTKGNVWKASYHDSRSVLFLEQWMTEGGALGQVL